LTIGVEIELQLLDPKTFDLIPVSENLLKECRINGLDRVKAEIHRSMLEIDSEISSDIKEARNYLEDRLVALNSIAESSGVQLCMTGTHPFQQWKDRLISKSDRYEFLHEKYQWLVRRMNVYGLHVHVGMPSGDRALAVSQAMIQYLPHLLALSANSPYWQGIDTGMQSSRVSIMEAFPFSGIPPYFKSWNDLQYFFNTMYRVGSITSLKDLYWYIRPNLDFGTIEFRICDVMSTLSETMAVVALIHCLVARVNKQLDEGLSQEWSQELHWIAPHNLWIAARDGLEGNIIIDLEGGSANISNSILDLVEQLSSIANDLSCLEELEYLKRMVFQGNGAQRQRAVYAETSSLLQVVSSANQALNDDLKSVF